MASHYLTRGNRLISLLLLAAFTVSAPVSAQTSAALDTEDSKILYTLGLAMAQSLESFALTEDELQLVQRGLADSVLGRDPQVDLQEYGPKLQTFADQRSAGEANAEKTLGAALLDEMAAEDGAVRTASGLVITEITAGTGASPGATDTVTVHYHGTLRDGTVFDSSVERSEPTSFPLNQVIPCWTEGVQRMRVGSKHRLSCPSDIAYGDQGRPGIPPGAVLVFEVELIEIQG